MMRDHPVLVEIMIAASISVTVFVPINPRTKGKKWPRRPAKSGAPGEKDVVLDEIPKTPSEKPIERFLIERFAPDAEGVYTAP
jgi:hypothetical protein